MSRPRKPTVTVQSIRFDDLDGSGFERLVFAYHCRTDRWRSLEWYGQVGSDSGRDIWGVREDDTTDGESVCIQCANRKTLTAAKANEDIDKVVKSKNGAPNRFRIVSRADVSAQLREKIKKHAHNNGIVKCDIWSGREFEELLRRDAESLLKRFVDGELFPDAASELAAFAKACNPLNDRESLALVARVFDRPAFYTPLQCESSLPEFKQAITDTIQAIGTGIWKSRDGHVIAKIPSRQQLNDTNLRDKMLLVEKELSKLRSRFDAMLRSHEIRKCTCKDPNCNVYQITPVGAAELQGIRDSALRLFKDAYPDFVLPTSW